MSGSKRVLAFDFGASSGRAMIGSLEDGKLQLKEIHRFSNDPVTVNGTIHWDTLRLFFEIKQGINKAVLDGGFESIGIDTWGVDFGLISKKGGLLQNPVHYRDARTDGMTELVYSKIPKEELYSRTGIQIMSLNTLFQVMAVVSGEPEIVRITDKLLFTPDLFNYMLTGVKKAEYTIASTSQMLDPHTKDWDLELLRQLEIPSEILCDIVMPGQVVGQLSDEICEELSAPKADVVAICSHDTQSAIVAVPADEEDYIYISCGTWSLFGTEMDKPLIRPEFADSFTNEGGYNNKITFLKNIMGLWLIQESRRQWQREGADVTYADLESEALEVQPLRSFIDPDAVDFVRPGNLPRRIQEFCERTGQPIPQTRGEIMRCVYDSLAMKYKYAFCQMKELTGKDYKAVYIVGGGTKDRFLCQLAANACGVTVKAGPIEATAIGNVTVQLISKGIIRDLSEAREIIAKSFERFVYEPSDSGQWEKAYNRFVQIIGK